MLTRSGHQRRLLIQKAGGSLLLLPLLRVLDESEALGATIKTPRAIFAFFGGGATHDHFWPGGGNGAIGNLSTILSPMEAHKADMLLFKGLCTRGGTNHQGGMFQALAGWGARSDANQASTQDMTAKPNSIDNIIADKWSGSTVRRNLILGVQSQHFGNPFTKTISHRNGDAQTPYDNPKSAYQDLFGNFKLPEGGTSAQKDADLAVANGKKRIIDYLRRDVKRIESSIGSYERDSFQTHVASIDELGKEIDQTIKGIQAVPPPDPTTAMNCNPKAMEGEFPNLNDEWFMKNEYCATVFKLHRKILVQALSCNVSRVAVWQMGNSHQETEMNAEGVNERGKVMHLRAHDQDMAYANVQRGIINELSKLITDLKSAKIGDHSIFDETLLYACSDLGDIPNDHSGVNVPAFIVGNPLKKLKQNYHASFKYERFNYTWSNGMDYSRALVTVAHALGLTDVQTVGYLKGQGPIAECFV